MPSQQIPPLGIAAGFALSLMLWTADVTVLAQPSERVVSEKPASGRFVETEQGFMVPYTATIPGTEVTFRMIPVPGNAKTSVDPYWIGQHEVKADEFVEFMKLYDVFKRLEYEKRRIVNDENQIDAISAPTPVYEPMFHFEFTTGPDTPAVSMSRLAARQYTKWLSLISAQQYRLPTEEEWEHACRAGTKTKWSFGNDPSQAAEYCVFIENSAEDGPRVVGSLKPNAWGIHDMHGNVSEWVLTVKNLRNHRTLGQLPGKWDYAAYDRQFKSMVLKGGNSQQPVDDCQVSVQRFASRDFWEYDPDLPQSPHWLACEDCRYIGFRIVSPLNEHAHDDIEQYWGPDTMYLVHDVQDRVDEGRGVLGLVDETLPVVVRELFDKSTVKRERPPWDHQNN